MTAFLRWLRSLPLPAWLASMLDAWQEGGEPDNRATGSTPPSSGEVVQAGSVAPAVPEAPAGAGPRRINAAGLALVKASEGLRLTAYQDSGGVWTIGYGHTGYYPGGWLARFPAGRVGAGDEIDEDDAVTLLLLDLGAAERAVAKETSLAGDGISDNEHAALVDFTFNLGGVSRPGSPSPLRQLLAHGLDQVPDQLLRWDHAAGVELAGLKLRREREAQLWRTGSWA